MKLYNQWRQKRRCKKIVADLSEALALMANGLRAGLSLVQSIQMASLELEGALGEELATVIHQVKLGKSLEEALVAMDQRVGAEEVSFVVQSILTLKSVGGNLVKHFDSLGAILRERQKIYGKIKVLTAEGMMQTVIIGLMPPMLCAGLAVLSPDFIAPLFGTVLGRLMLAGVILLEGMGLLWLRKILVIRV